jgi:proteasome lid subunit RPN8/RPN11
MDPAHVVLSKGIHLVLVDAAIEGYEARYKEERLGILLGTVQDKAAVVKRAILYRDGKRTRTEASVNPDRFTQRVQDLSRKYKSDFLGTFHTHNEVAGTISSALSVADRDHLCSDPPHQVELIIAVWGADSPSRQSQRYIQGDLNGYRFRIVAYQMCSPFRLIPVFSTDAK